MKKKKKIKIKKKRKRKPKTNRPKNQNKIKPLSPDNTIEIEIILFNGPQLFFSLPLFYP